MSRLAAIRRGRSLGAKISGGRGCPWIIFFGFYKTRQILLSDGANCTVLCAVVLTQYRHVTDGNAIASTALAMRALRRAVKNIHKITVINTFVMAALRSRCGHYIFAL